MTTSTARVLALLEILQSGGIRTVGDLAARLDVDERTIRRSVKHLLDLDVPAGFDPVTAVVSGLAATPWQHRVSLRIRDDVEHLRRHLPASVAAVTELDDGWLQVGLRAEKLDWVASTLAALDRPFAVEEPAALRDSIRALADRLTGYVG